MAAVGNKSVLKFSLANNVVSHLKVETVFWFKDLNIELAFRVIVSHCPCTHDGVLILEGGEGGRERESCLLYTSPSPRDATLSRMPSSA